MKRLNPKSIKIACVQINASPDWQKNLARLTAKWLPRAFEQKVDLIALPEMFHFRGKSGEMAKLATDASPQILSVLKMAAQKHKTAILAGSLPEPARDKSRYYNTSYFIEKNGRIISKYRKIHLFDIALKNKISLQESRHVIAGRNVVSFQSGGLKMGHSICYDLRFPEMFRKLSAVGCRVIFVPANFTFETGKAHWEILLRARAIENQVFIVAPNQGGRNEVTGVRSFGHSMIISPWGEMLAEAKGVQEDMIVAKLDLAGQNALKSQFPVLLHRKL